MKYTLLLLALILATAQANLITLDTRLGVTQQIFIEQPNNSKANLVLFAGGKGKIKLSSGKYKTNNNFLIRSRHLFANNNFSTVLIDGLVLTSSISKTNNKGTSVTDLDLDRITVPVLVTHHTQDACKTTKPKVVNAIERKAYNSSQVTVKLFSDGDTPISKNPCQARTYHGYFGIENEVIDFIASFINQHK